MEILAPTPETRLRDLSQLQSLAFIFHPSFLADSDCHDIMPRSLLLINKLYSTVDLSHQNDGDFKAYMMVTKRCNKI